MIVFLRFLIVACIALVSWWQLGGAFEQRAAASVALLGISGLAALLVCKGIRIGLWMTLLLGLGHLSGLLLRVPSDQVLLALPFLVWCFLAISGSALLLGLSRQRRHKHSAYERYPEF